MTDPTVNDTPGTERASAPGHVRTINEPLDDTRVERGRNDDTQLERGHVTDSERVSPAGASDPVVRERADTTVADEEPVRRLGGIRWGAAFFGWLCATGISVLLIALVAATGTAVGLTRSTVDDVIDSAASNAEAVSLGGIAAVMVVLALGYLAGGYVAARMARFDGRRQGFAAWVVGVVVTVLVAAAGVVLGSAYDVLARLDLPRIPLDDGAATTGGVIALVAVLLVTLFAAILGGTLGDRYHRRLDVVDVR